MSAPEVRPAAPADWAQIERVCADTGAGGDAVDPAEADDFVAHWIRPYRELRPDWTWTAVADGRVIGYLTACPDSLAFERERRRVFSPPPDSRDFFPELVRLKLWNEHPAHLLMNVSAPARGRGAGAALLRALFAALRRERVPSAHLICGPASAGYWERMAFRTEAITQPSPGLVLRAMTRPVE
jgi:GNAT superfamily N-acetyltransferase